MSGKSSTTALKNPRVIYTPASFRAALHALYEGERIALASGGHFERTPLLMTGPPGSVKTATVSAFVDDLREAAELTHPGEKNVRLLTLRVTQCEITDLKGVPVYIEVNDGKQCSFASPSEFPIVGMPDSAGGYKMTVIFFDELQQAIPQMQQLCAAILDGTIGDQKLDMNRTFVVGAANRVEDSATVYPLPMNLANRFAHGTMDIDAEGWLTWGQNTGINSVILGLLAQSTSLLNEPTPPAGTENTPYATPRTWAKLSQILNGIEAKSGDSWVLHPDKKLIRSLVLSTVGHSAGTQLIATGNNIAESINVNHIEEGKNPKAPTKPDVQFAVVYELINRTSNILKGVEQCPLNNQQEIMKVLRGIERKDLKRLENILDWMGGKLESTDDKLNASMVAIYRGKNTHINVKTALQLLAVEPEFNLPSMKKALELQKGILRKYSGVGGA